MKYAIPILILIICLSGCQSTFLNGISFCTLPPDCTAQLNELNSNAVHYQIHWKDIEPQIGQAFQWTVYDTKIKQTYNQYVQSAIIGGVNKWDLPTGINIDTDWEGFLHENYDFIYLTVSRYKDYIDFWWIMPEMNEARLRILFGWLEGYPFNDYDKLDQLCERQYQAIKDADPDAMVGVVFHTSIHPNIHHDVQLPPRISGSMIAGPYDWMEMLDRWLAYCDVVGLDNYPNYYCSDPVYSLDLYNQGVEACKRGKPVMVLETQYPYSRVSLPSPVGFTEANQATYLSECYEYFRSISYLNQGTIWGFFVFNLYANGVPNNYTPKDWEALGVLGPAFHDGNATVLINYLLENMDYCRNVFPEKLRLSEYGLGILGTDGHKTQAFNTVRDMFYEPPE